jgi:hypothetical protein
LKESWKTYEYSDSSYVEASITKIDTMLIADNITDSIKVITYMKKDKLGNISEDSINNKQIILSRNYGIMRYFDYEFAMFKGITRREIYDFDIGDKFHYWKNYWDANLYSLYTVIDKSYSPEGDEVAYTMSEEYVFFAYPGPSRGFDTIVQVNSDLDSLVHKELPQEVKYFGSASKYNMFTDPEKYNNRLVLADYCGSLIKYDRYDTCFYHYFEQICAGYVYIKGCGSFLASDIDETMFKNYYTKLSYFKKGDEEYGNPTEINEIPEYYKEHDEFTIFPVPVNQNDALNINILYPANLSINIIDCFGRIVAQLAVDTYYEKGIQQFSLAGENPEAGMYFLEIRNNKSAIVKKLNIK